MHSQTFKELEQGARFLALVLLTAYICSLGARLHWALDLFSHFVIQYMVGGIILGLLFIYFRKFAFAFLMFVIAGLSLFEIYRLVDILPPSGAKPDFTIAQYNRRYDLPDHTPAMEWIENSGADVVVLQEARDAHALAAESLRSLYPHQIHEPRLNAFGMVIISKFPFKSHEIVPTQRYALDNFFVKIVVEPRAAENISVYAEHPPPPTSGLLLQQRNNDLAAMIEAVRADKNENVILVGDWNLTPYSPYFSDVLTQTGVKYQMTDMAPFPTWPSHFVFPFLQIPIDHILSKGNLVLLKKSRAPAMNSDHYPVIASFALAPHNQNHGEPR